MLVIVHSGQTGVERGAHRAAVSAGLAIAGFMPLDKRDELGPIPNDVVQLLTSCFDRGPRPAVRANIALASGVLLVVPEASTPEKFTPDSAASASDWRALRRCMGSFVCRAAWLSHCPALRAGLQGGEAYRIQQASARFDADRIFARPHFLRQFPGRGGKIELLFGVQAGVEEQNERGKKEKLTHMAFNAEAEGLQSAHYCTTRRSSSCPDPI